MTLILWLLLLLFVGNILIGVWLLMTIQDLINTQSNLTTAINTLITKAPPPQLVTQDQLDSVTATAQSQLDAVNAAIGS